MQNKAKYKRIQELLFNEIKTKEGLTLIEILEIKKIQTAEEKALILIKQEKDKVIELLKLLYESQLFIDNIRDEKLLFGLILVKITDILNLKLEK